MMATPIDPAAEVASAVAAYKDTNNVAALLDRLSGIASVATTDALVAAVEPYRDIPEVAGPIYERVVAERPDDARALVVLATAYWLAGRGPDVVGDLASRALAADPENRAAWHLWALTEPVLRERAARWAQVSARFPGDDMALAALADNSASLAATEYDERALAVAIQSFETLLTRAELPEQRQAVTRALETLRKWKM
jgi:hypothetical protein